jgi:hypothetical protein
MKRGFDGVLLRSQNAISESEGWEISVRILPKRNASACEFLEVDVARRNANFFVSKEGDNG